MQYHIAVYSLVYNTTRCSGPSLLSQGLRCSYRLITLDAVEAHYQGRYSVLSLDMSIDLEETNQLNHSSIDCEGLCQLAALKQSVDSRQDRHMVKLSCVTIRLLPATSKLKSLYPNIICLLLH